MGRWCTFIGVLISVGTAYLVQHAASIMDYVQGLFSFFIAPLFGTVILGMLWKRATKAGGFWGLLAGTCTAIGLFLWVHLDPSALRYVALSADAKTMAEDMYRALWSWLVCVIVTVVSELCDEAEAGVGAGGTGVRRGSAAGGAGRPLVSETDCMGGRDRGAVCDSQHYFLVGGETMREEISIWFFGGVLFLLYGVIICGRDCGSWAIRL